MSNEEFSEAAWWLGVVMEIQEFRKFIWSPENEEESDTTVLYADKNDKNGRKAIKFKVEQNLHINRQQIDILEYFITNKKGLIAWIKMDPR